MQCVTPGRPEICILLSAKRVGLRMDRGNMIKDASVRKLLVFFVAVWFLLVVLRLAFAVWQWESLSVASWDDICYAFYIGAKFDGRIAVALSLPMLLLLFLPGLRSRVSRWSRGIGLFYGVVFFLLFSLYLGDFGHFSYLGLRINAAFFDMARDLKTSAQMVWESYPVIPCALALLIAAYISCRMVRRFLSSFAPTRISGLRRVRNFLLCFIVLGLVGFGQISTNLFPLRWSHAYFSGNPNVTALALNPIQNIIDTYKSVKANDYDIEKVRRYYPAMASFLGVTHPDEAALNFERTVPERPLAESGRRPNVVLIIMESFSHHKSSFAPYGPDTTPETLALAKESAYFSSYFAPARTTARAIFSLFTGIPDINQSYQTSSRNPFVVNQRLILNEFKGYAKFYCLGGNASWANIRGFLEHNVDDLVILEEGAWKASNVDVWGISDLDLFRESHEVLEKAAAEGKPVFMAIQTAAFHKPFTIPKDHGSFKIEERSSEFLKKYGFVSLDEYNSFRFCDYALHEFMNLAKNSSYYKDTIFVITGDHGLTEHSPAAPEGYQELRLSAFHVPLIIHGPGVVPGEYAKSGTHLDVFPTIAGLLGIGYKNYTLGRDLFDPRFDGSRYAFVGRAAPAPLLLVDGDLCLYDNRDGEAKLLRYDAEDWRKNCAGEYPELFTRLDNVANGIFNTAKYMLYNNKRQSWPVTKGKEEAFRTVSQ